MFDRRQRSPALFLWEIDALMGRELGRIPPEVRGHLGGSSMTLVPSRSAVGCGADFGDVIQTLTTCRLLQLLVAAARPQPFSLRGLMIQMFRWKIIPDREMDW